MEDLTWLLLLILSAGVALGFKYYGALCTLREDWRTFQAFQQEYQAFLAWRAGQVSGAAHVGSALAPSWPRPEAGRPEGALALPATAQRVPGAGRAMLNPPSLLETIRYMKQRSPADRYLVPLGWAVHEGRGDLVYTSFVGETNIIGITVQNDGGKDNLVRGMLLALAAQHSPTEVKFWIMDPKVLDSAAWQGCAHVAYLSLDDDDETIKRAAAALTQERRRRRDVLLKANCLKWEDYQGDDLPLLIVYISELTLLKAAMGEAALDKWLTKESSTGRAQGIRFIIASQTFKGYDTAWRMQASINLSGYQSRPEHDLVATGLYTEQLVKAGAVPPSQLPPAKEVPGVFTAVAGSRLATTVRSTYVTPGDYAWWIAMLQQRYPAPQPEMVAQDDAQVLAELLQPATAAIPEPQPAAPADLEVPVVDRRRILEAATRLSSRRDVCQEVYGSTGGENYKYIKAVLAPYDKLPIPVQVLVA